MNYELGMNSAAKRYSSQAHAKRRERTLSLFAYLKLLANSLITAFPSSLSSFCWVESGPG
jgi:hypothetical protein